MPFFTGNQATFTYTGAEALVVANFDGWAATFQRNGRMVRPYGQQLACWLQGTLVVSGTLVGFVDALPPIPSGATGTLVLTHATGITRTFKATLQALQTGGKTTGNPRQTVTYAFQCAAENAQDGVT